MSDNQNTQIVQNAYTCFGTGDVPGLLGLMSDDISWTTPELENAPFGGTITGKDEVAGFFMKLSETEDFTNFEPKEFIAAGDRVVVLGTLTSTVRETGTEYTMDWIHVFGLSDSKVTSFLEFFDTALVDRAFQKAAAV